MQPEIRSFVSVLRSPVTLFDRSDEEFIIYLFISLLHRPSQRKAIIKGEGELDVDKSFSVCVNVHVLL